MQFQNYRISPFINLIRVNQWVKNTFVFLPMFFNKQLMSFESLSSASVAFFSFSLIASSIYCLNDILDVNFDKNHIQKKSRPIASGKVSKSKAFKYMVVLAIIGFLLALMLNSIELTYALFTYFLLNILYSILFKNFIVIDVIIIAVSFVLRIIAGAVATKTELSNWILIMVFLLALLLALAKRRDEVLVYKETGMLVRRNIKAYSLTILNVLLICVAVIIVGGYIMYTLSDAIILQFGNKYLVVTSIFVVLGIVRYFKLIKHRIAYANPTKILLTDHVMQLIVFGWLISFYLFIYIK